ncbi:MAG: type II toxin-antitoxin system VapC family toxin [Armatimonadetes bacterium]|nr:type II toxin-antitoxin system VapC family toxin [Armatimonadota bacterium]
MSYLLDTNVLVRLFDLNDPRNPEIAATLDTLTTNNTKVYVCAQVLIEYWVVATRPRESNGLGFSAIEADRYLGEIETLFDYLSDPTDILRRWRTLVVSNGVIGKSAHDARIAALMCAHSIRHLLTLNPAHFTRYPQILPLTPNDVLRMFGH